jgi:hypothetical protein
MSYVEAQVRIDYTTREVERYRVDVEDWKRKHDQVVNDLWVWEQLMSKANELFALVVGIDEDIQMLLLSYADANQEMLGVTRGLMKQWLTVSLVIRDQADRLRSEHGSAKDATELERNIEAAQAMLTPDSEFFDADELAQLCDRAVADNRAGLTEPFFANECAPE